MTTVRIFISSPGDVAEERERARQVIDSLKRRYAGRLELKPVLWEDLPLQADSSFQAGIDLVLSKEHELDVAVFILWSRLGSPLGAAIRKPDGSEYRSGTEREFDLMLQARKQSGGERPAFLVYTRRDEASFDERLRGKSTEIKQNILSQKKLVEAFIAEEFHDGGSGHNLRAYHSFDRPQTFSQRLRVHLQEILDEIAGGGVAEAVWDIDKKGAPFMGLEPFTAAQAEVFCGREGETLEAHRALVAQARSGSAFLLLTGASGSGKSSLARAGLLPAVAEHEIDETVAEWRTVTATPSELGSDPVAGLVKRLAEPGVLPELRAAGTNLDDVIEGLKSDPANTVNLVLKRAVAEASVTRKGGIRVLLLLDQLEEVFTSPGKDELLAVLAALAGSGVFWVVATVRGDFLESVQQDPVLVRLIGGSGLFPVLAPDADALRRVIEEPARLAGLHFEERDGRQLSDRILADAARHADLLPLLEYVLRELFDQRSANGALTWAAYESLGGVEGALAKRAEDVFSIQSAEVQARLPDVLNATVTISEVQGANETGERFVRKRSTLNQFIAGSPARQLVDALIRERMLTASAGDDTSEPSTVTLAHEALLRVWPRASAWAEGNRELLRTRARVSARMNEGSLLLEGDPLFDAARVQLAASPDAFDSNQRDYIQRSVQSVEAARHRRAALRRNVMIGLSLLTLLAIAGAALAWVKEREAVRLKEDAVALRENAEAEKKRAVEARKAANGLIRFMQYDLNDTLGKLGQLRMMEGINQRIRRYHEEHPAGKDDLRAQQSADRERAVAINQQGDILMAQGQLAEALTSYRASLEIRQRLAKSDPDNVDWQRSLSISQDNVGNVMVAQGQLAEALASYRASLEIRQRLAKSDPDNVDWQHALSVSQKNVGDVLRAQGQLAEALASYRPSLEISQRLAKSDPDNAKWQRYLSNIQQKVGRVLLAQDQLAEALASCRASLEISQRLAKSDPDNTEWQRSLAISQDSVGDVLVAQGQLAEALASCRALLEISQRLAKSDPDNSEWQRDLSIAQGKVGNVLLAQGQLAEALASYRASLEISQRLAKSDPDNTKWQRGLSDSQIRVGDVLVAQGQLAEALAPYRASLEIFTRLAKSDPDNAGWQRDLSVNHWKLADIAERNNDLQEGLLRFEAAREVLLAMQQRGILAPKDEQWIEACAQRISALREKVEKQ